MRKDPKPLSKDHFLYVKGIAILAVIVSHIGNFSGKTWFTPLGGVGVAIFLFCSGYGVMTSYYRNGLKLFWRNKFTSIYLPFVIVEIVAAVIYKHSIHNVLLELLFFKRLNPFGWYLQYLVVCYFLFYIITKLISDVRFRFAIWGILAILSFIFFPNLQGEQTISFISGLVIAERIHDNRIVFDYKKTLVLGGIAVILSVGFLAIKQLSTVREQTHYLITFINLILKSSAAIGIICITSYWTPLYRCVMLVGSISYSLYLIHGYFMKIISNNVFGNYYINSCVMLLLSFTVAIGLNMIVKRMKKGKKKSYDTQSISN